ncbi:MAG: N-acetylmuramoyl-L-alanine amidase [Candidatus Omnitrophica bacterium]|nr:N-acetylmuramoyl-L-alanine amidase [Candidatus Omnitrophota bacterium]
MRSKYFMYLCAAVLPILLSSCAAPRMRTNVPTSIMVPSVSTRGVVERHDMVHVVMPGETVFRLGRMYDVKVADILSRNGLKSSDTLKMGQKITIPGAAPLKEVIPVFPSRKWKYIIIHHSATDEDDAMSLYKMHQRRGWDSTGYDFLIDNGTKGTVAGHMDATPRWIAQKDGAHCKASNMNTKAIGICLIGNFSKENVSDEQLKALVNLVKYLRAYYNIPLKNIMGHGQVPEAATECPGKLFPWKRFWELLASAGSR